MDFHPVAEIFPLMKNEEFEKLVQDIRVNGLLVPIWTFKGKIVDGRSRFNACRELGFEPRYREYRGGGKTSLVTFVVSLNLHRRHLNESQRAMVAARIANLRSGQTRSAASIEAPRTQVDAAHQLNVSRASVQRARKVLNDGGPELVNEVVEGKISVYAAGQIAFRSKEKQRRIISTGRRQILQTATHIKVEKNLKHARSTYDLCLLCNDGIGTKIDNFLAFLEALEEKLPGFAEYISPIADEMYETETTKLLKTDSGKILHAIRLGYREIRDIQKLTKIPVKVLRFELDWMKEVQRLIVCKKQGGKTDGARGQRKTLWFERENQLEVGIPLHSGGPPNSQPLTCSS